MPDRPWETELEQFLQSKLDALSVTPNQGIGRPAVRIFPPPAADEAKYFMLALDAGMFELDDNGVVHSRLIGPGIDVSASDETFPLFADVSSSPRLIRERIWQLATAGALIYERGWLERQVELLPNTTGGADILLHASSGKLLAAVSIKRTTPELSKLVSDLQQCCQRGEHPIDNCGFPQNHRHFEFCASHQPPYFWAVAPAGDICFKMTYPPGGSIEVEELPTLPRRSRIELEHESFWGKAES